MTDSPLARLQRPRLYLLVVLFSLLAGCAAQSSTPISAGRVRTLEPASRIEWQGGSRYLHGANMPWYHWGCDFGCGVGQDDQRGVSDPTVTAILREAFTRAQASGLWLLRWWVFPGEANQIRRDADGAPAGLNPAVYADFDAALELAAAHNITYEFTLFSAPSHLPQAWLTDPAQRAKLVEALTPLFARYAGHPRLLAWDIFNEPEWDIWNGLTPGDAVQATVKELAAAVHAQGGTYVTVGSAMLDGLPLWADAGLDFYQAHWYDYMSAGNWCAYCTTYAEVRSRYNLNAPLIIGEFYAGPETDAATRFEAWHSKGYSGALAWSLFPERTHDKLPIDLAAAAAFAQQHRDLGPAAP